MTLQDHLNIYLMFKNKFDQFLFLALISETPQPFYHQKISIPKIIYSYLTPIIIYISISGELYIFISQLLTGDGAFTTANTYSSYIVSYETVP